MALPEEKQESGTVLEMHHADYSMYISAPGWAAMRLKALRLTGREALATEYRWSLGARLFLSRSEPLEPVGLVDGIGFSSGINISGREEAIFFENTDYMVEVEFAEYVSDARLLFPRFFGEDGKEETVWSYMPRRRMLSFGLNYGNEIGQSDIRIEYYCGNGGGKRLIELHFDVLSVKIDYHKDLGIILRDIEKEYVLLSLSFLRKTYQTFDVDAGNADTPDLIWWNLFKELQEEFCSAAAFIIDRPHNRLRRAEEYVRADKLKRITPSLANELARYEDVERHLYNTEEWELNDDTEENRFLKFALLHTEERFSELRRKIESRVSDQACLDGLKEVGDTMKRLLSSPFLRRIGSFKGFKGDNLTLKRGMGYSTIYRDWLLLQSTYDLHDGIHKMELKDIAELYEIWCFIEVKNIVRQLMAEKEGVEEEKVEQVVPLTSLGNGDRPLGPDTLRSLRHGEDSIIKLRHGDVELAEVVYNAQFGLGENQGNGFGGKVSSQTVAQRPDIVLRLTKDDVRRGMKLTYLFDAKYRMDVDGTPPEDSINQMHRYRDAIYYSEEEVRGNTSYKGLKREVVGGYILFPGLQPSEEEEKADGYKNPEYNRMGGRVNIGAFPLRPSADKGKDRWLRNFLRGIILSGQENLLKDSIPQKGLRYETDKPRSAFMLVGYSSDPKLMEEKGYYYIPAAGKDRRIKTDYTKVRYILIHSGGRAYKLFDNKMMKVELVTGKRIRELGLNEQADPEKVYILFHLKKETNKGDDGTYIMRGEASGKERFDINKVNLLEGKGSMVPRFIPVDKAY